LLEHKDKAVTTPCHEWYGDKTPPVLNFSTRHRWTASFVVQLFHLHTWTPGCPYKKHGVKWTPGARKWGSLARRPATVVWPWVPSANAKCCICHGPYAPAGRKTAAVRHHVYATQPVWPVAMVIAATWQTKMRSDYASSYWRHGAKHLKGSLSLALTYSMQHRPSWKANKSSATQEIPRILWYPKVHSQQPVICPCPQPHRSSPRPRPTSWRSILIVSSHLRLGLPSGLLPSGFATKTLYAPLFSPIRAVCPVHLSILTLSLSIRT
jgi:hypothetical protein